jgi:arsenate reductase (glutaredoxin)
MKYTIYHNPRCSKSREALSLLQEDEGAEIEIVKYLEDIPTEDQMLKLLSKLNIKPFDLVRKTEKIYKEQYKKLNLNDHEWIKVMLENPKLIERPIIIKGNKAIIGRPPSLVLDL